MSRTNEAEQPSEPNPSPGAPDPLRLTVKLPDEERLSPAHFKQALIDAAQDKEFVSKLHDAATSSSGNVTLVAQEKHGPPWG